MTESFDKNPMVKIRLGGPLVILSDSYDRQGAIPSRAVQAERPAKSSDKT